MTNQNKQPITRHYILGIGRSGTTLLVNVFNRHKNVLATPESVFTQFFFSSFKNKTVFTEKDISAILDYIATYEKLAPFINWSFEYSFFKSIKYPLEMTFDDLINLIHLQFKFPQHEQQEIRYIVDKNPGNSLFGEQLFQLNENSKLLVNTHVLPEMNHNELVGWDSGTEKHVAIIIRTPEDNIRSRFRMDFCSDIFRELEADVIMIDAIGENQMQRLMYLNQLSDWLSLLLAERSGTCPVDIKNIIRLKSALESFNG